MDCAEPGLPRGAATAAAPGGSGGLQCKADPKPGPRNSPCSFWSQDKGEEGVRQMHLGLPLGQEKARTVRRLGRNGSAVRSGEKSSKEQV